MFWFTRDREPRTLDRPVIESVRATNAELLAEVNDEREENARLARRVQELEDLNGRLADENRNMASQRAAFRNEIHALRLERDAMKAEAQDGRGKWEEIARQSDVVNAENDRLTEENRQFKQSVAGLMDHNQDLAADNERLTEENKAFWEDIQTLKAERDELRAAWDALRVAAQPLLATVATNLGRSRPGVLSDPDATHGTRQD